MTERESSSTDILRLFREDLDPSDRVEAFRQAADQIREEVDVLATPENVEIINQNYNLTFVFNSHGDATDAGQSVAEVKRPFITFVESAGEADFPQNAQFDASVHSAFDVLYNGKPPIRPPFQPVRETQWPFWRDYGLFVNASIVAPIDVRHYSRRLLDALMGSDYDQGYLNSTIHFESLRQKPFDEQLTDQKQKGQLIMLSNAVRELTSTKQVIEMLLHCVDPHADTAAFTGPVADKIRAVAQKRRDQGDKLEAFVMYGTGHHAIMHVFRGLGIEAQRVFPGAIDMDGSLKFSGTVKDQFFSAHPFGLNDEQIEKYAKHHIIESILWAPLNKPTEYGIVFASDKEATGSWHRINYVARRPELVERAEELYQEFQRDPSMAIELLENYGIGLRRIGQPNS